MSTELPWQKAFPPFVSKLIIFYSQNTDSQTPFFITMILSITCLAKQNNTQVGIGGYVFDAVSSKQREKLLFCNYLRYKSNIYNLMFADTITINLWWVHKRIQHTCSRVVTKNPFTSKHQPSNDPVHLVVK